MTLITLGKVNQASSLRSWCVIILICIQSASILLIFLASTFIRGIDLQFPCDIFDFSIRVIMASERIGKFSLLFYVLEKFVENWYSFFKCLIGYTCPLGLGFSSWAADYFVGSLIANSASLVIGLYGLSVSCWVSFSSLCLSRNSSISCYLIY